MLSFKQYLSEAFNLFPKTEKDIDTLVPSFNDDIKTELKNLFTYLKKIEPSIIEPIVLNPSKKNSVKIMRAFQSKYTMAQIKKGAGFTKLSAAFGNGSSGNRGANNRGNLFEIEFANAIKAWMAGEEVKDANIVAAIEDLNKTYNLSKSKTFDAKTVGGQNTRRPLEYSNNSAMLTNPSGSGFDIGSAVTDITLYTDSGEIYLSLKLGGTTTFFNVGIRTVLTSQEIKSGQIRDKRGLILLHMFGIDPIRFCDVFNGNPIKDKVDQNPSYNKQAVQKLIESGIGYGYHIIHKKGKKILSKKMDKMAMKYAAKIGKIRIYYGGMTGTGKRIDIAFESPEYKFKLNIRDTQGGDGYPTRMLCDFTHK